MHDLGLRTAAMAAATMLLPAAAAGQTVVLGSSSSATIEALSEALLPAFEAETGYRVDIIRGASANHLARLQAQQGNQEMDVVMLDDFVMRQAVALDFCEPLPGDVLAGFRPDTVVEERAVAGGVFAIGIAYNSDLFAANGWEAPASWLDLGREELRDYVSIPTLSNSYGLYSLLMVNRALGGDEFDVDPGFAYVEAQVAPNVVTFVESTTRLGEMLQTGEAAVGTWGSSRVMLLQAQGFPVSFVFPEEGAIAGASYLCVVAGTQEPEAARALVAMMTGPEAQALYAERFATTPTRTDVELPAEIAALLLTEDELDRLVRFDAQHVGEAWPAWTNRWVREIER